MRLLPWPYYIKVQEWKLNTLVYNSDVYSRCMLAASMAKPAPAEDMIAKQDGHTNATMGHI